MRRRINAQLAKEAIAEILQGPVAPAEPAKTADELWQERMAAQRRAWREQDTRRYVDKTKEQLLEAGFRDDLWHVYTFHRKRWHFVGTRDMKTHRRKPMTLNRLFASIRMRFGIPRNQPVKLISQVDDQMRKQRGDPFISPQHMRGRDAIVQ